MILSCFQFCNALSLTKYDCGFAFFSRKESKFGYIFIKDVKAVCCAGVKLSGFMFFDVIV